MNLPFKIVAFLMLMIIVACTTFQTSNNSAVVKEEINYIPYYLKVCEADSLFLTKEYSKCYRILDSLFNKYTPLNMENYNEYSVYIACSAMTGNVEGLDKKVEYGFKNFGSIGFFHRDSESIYDSIIKYSGLTKEKALEYKTIYSKTINLDLRKRIQIMEEEDQSCRAVGDLEKMIYYQNKHKPEIIDIIERYGYPNYQIIGKVGFSMENNDETPFMFKPLFLHQEIEIQKKYLPVFLEQVKKGKFLPEEYAAIYDKSLQEVTAENTLPKTLYGSFPDYPLLYPEKIDSIRKSIGLPRLGYSLWSYKMVFNN